MGHRFTRPATVGVITLAVMILLFAGTSSAWAMENTECLSCHAVGGPPGPRDVEFAVGSVDLYRCDDACHRLPYHFARSTGDYYSDYSTPYGWFDSADSLNASPADLHLIHAGSYPAVWNPDPNAVGDNACAGCHSAVKCSACHADDVPHADHTLDAGTYAYPPVEVTVCEGVLSSQQTQAEAVFDASLTCANSSCHALPGTDFVVAPSCESCHGTHNKKRSSRR